MHRTVRLLDARGTLPGRDTPTEVAPAHFVNGKPMRPPFAQGLEEAVFGEARQRQAEDSKRHYQDRLSARGFGVITMEMVAALAFYHAEDCHRQCLDKNPGGYRGLGGTGADFDLASA
jgi:hypothetical protein